MTDPAETARVTAEATQQTTVLAGGGLFTVAGILAAAHRLYVAVFGTRAERAAARVAEADAGTRVATVAIEVLSDEREETQRTRAQRDMCEERLAQMGERMGALERRFSEHMATCGPRMERMEWEQRQSRAMLHDYMHSTPPPRYTGDDVMAEMGRIAQERTREDG